MKLRKTIQRRVFDELDNSCFTAEDFIVTFADTKDIEALINIKFLHDQHFSFDVFYDEEKYWVTMVPGQIAEEGSLEISSIDQLLEAVPLWANEVRRELRAENISINDIDELRNIISDHLNGNSKGEEFSVYEINELQEKFRELEKRISRLEQDKIITETQFKEFEKGITQISSDVEYYPKQTWLKTAPNKLLKLLVNIGKSQEGRKILADGARKLLGIE
jgi:hypothetical protein